MKQLEILCPICKKKFNYYSSTFRPFCSEKCRLIDLGQWLNESYTVPVKDPFSENQNQDSDIRPDGDKSDQSGDSSDY